MSATIAYLHMYESEAGVLLQGEIVRPAEPIDHLAGISRWLIVQQVCSLLADSAGGLGLP